MNDIEIGDLLYGKVGSYTMIGPETAWSMYQSAKFCVEENVPGDLVECGVWKGGSLMAGMLAFMMLGDLTRDVWAYDTFTGMPAPEQIDGHTAREQYDREKGWCLVNQDTVTKTLLSTGYPAEKVHIIAGKVEDTIPARIPETIAVLRLDTDWYASTKHELEHLYPRLSPGGVLIVDDYGCWPGSRAATDEYFGNSRLPMTNINWTARMMRKPR